MTTWKLGLLPLLALILPAQVVVSGKVIDATTGAEIAGVKLSLATANGPSTVSDDAGVFELSGVFPSGATVSAQAPGYISKGTVVSYAPGAGTAQVKVQLTPEGVIAGKVLGEGGATVGKALVCVVRYILVSGQRIPRSDECTGSDDRGEYRLAGLPPGRYYLRAGPPNPMSPWSKSWDANYAPAFYPGTAQPAEANLLDVQAGTKRAGMDIQLRKSNGVIVSGRVSPAGKGQVSLESPAFVNLAYAVRANVLPDGSYVFPHVQPGTYVLRYVSGSYPPKPGELWAERPLEVGAIDLQNQKLEARNAKPQDVMGTLVFPKRIQPQALDVMLVGTYPGTHVTAALRTVHTQSAADGTFVLKGLLAGHYDVVVRPLMAPGGLGTPYLPLSSAKFGNREVAASGLDLADDTAGRLRIAIAKAPANVSGQIETPAGQPATMAALLFVPTHGDHPAFTSASLLGRFNLFLPAGDYRVYALRDLNQAGTLENRQYLSAHAKDFPRFHVAAGENSPLNLTLR